MNKYSYKYEYDIYIYIHITYTRQVFLDGLCSICEAPPPRKEVY